MHCSTFLAGFGAAVLFWTTAPAAAQVPLTTELFVSGVSGATELAFAPGDPSRVFIVEQSGRIRVVENGSLLSTPFLDISPMVSAVFERGLLGLAFHPDYQTNGRFFVNFTETGLDTRVAEFAVTADPNIADPNVVQIIAAIEQDFGNHNGGCVRFGPDGKLYVGMGDGGSQNDPNGRAQDGMQRLGKMLRYDIDIPAPFIPADNPFVGVSGVRDEIWHLGVRNPWRFSFDRMTGDLWIADVGGNQREELDFIPAGVSGMNLGWRCKEGTLCTGLSGCVCTDPTLIDPIVEYDHSVGCSIVGGHVYRGSAIPSLHGTYFYGDFCTSRIWSLKYDGLTVSEFTEREAELDPAGSASIGQIRSFGEDIDGEMYILTWGRVWKIVEDVPPCGYTTYCTAIAGSSGVPAGIIGSGSTSISANDFGLAANDVPPNTLGLFFYGPEQMTNPSGLGNLCIAGNATRPLIRIYPALQADIVGSVILPIDMTAPNQSMGPGAINAGDTLNFQFWFRDNQGGAPSWNFTNGLSALFCP